MSKYCVYTSGELTADDAMDIRRDIDSCIARGAQEIHIVVNSQGGCVSSGLGLIDYIERLKLPVTIEVQGMAWSMWFYILQAADTRIMSQNSSLMAHVGEFAVEGSPEMAKTWLKESERADKTLQRILVKSTGKDNRYWNKLLGAGHDKVFTATEALKHNLIDKII